MLKYKINSKILSKLLNYKINTQRIRIVIIVIKEIKKKESANGKISSIMKVVSKMKKSCKNYNEIELIINVKLGFVDKQFIDETSFSRNDNF